MGKNMPGLLGPKVDVFTVDEVEDDEKQQDLIRGELEWRWPGRAVSSMTIIPGMRSVDPRIRVRTLRCYVVWDQNV